MSLSLANISDGEGTHDLGYEGVWRTVMLEKGSLVCPPEEAGDSFKSSVFIAPCRTPLSLLACRHEITRACE